jgi:Zn-dependent protease
MSARPHFTVAGIPVRVEPFFLIVAVLFGLRYERVDVIAVWVAVMFVSILVHELGHALSLKLFGQSSSIVLHGFGGVTVSDARRQVPRTRSILVSVAGSLTALAVLWLPARSLMGTDWFFDQPLLVRYAIYFTAFANLWWSVANLLPIRPLDGGNVATQVLGLARARILSIAVCAAAAVWVFVWYPAQSFAGMFALILGFLNYSEIRAERQGARGSAFEVEAPQGPTPQRKAGWLRPASSRSTPPTPAPEARPVDPGLDHARIEQAAWAALTAGDARRAGALFRRLRNASGVSPFLAPAIALADGSTDLALDLYTRAWLARPQGPSQLVASAILGRSHAAEQLARRLIGQPGGMEAAATLQTHLHYAGSFRAAAEVGQVVAGSDPPSPAQTAFETACSWARAGELDQAVRWLQRAADQGFRAPGLVDGEPDLAALRHLPEWPALRARLA